MKSPKLTIIFAILCVVFAAMAGEARAADAWLRVQSKNFQLVGNASEKDLQLTATRLEQFRHVFTQLFPKMNFSAPIPTRVVVFKDNKSFDQFKPVEWAAGYFQAGDDVNYIVLSAERSDAEGLTTVFHEYTHFLVDNSLGRANVPPWFNEGIAEYYERFAIENDQKVTLGAVNQTHLRLLQQNKFIPFETFFATDYYTLHKQSKQSAQLFYAQSWVLLHYLLQSDGGARRAQFDKFVESLVQGSKPKDAFSRAFQMDIAALEAELTKYVAGKNYATSVVSLKEKLIFDNQMQAFAVSEADAKAYQGDLLYHTRRYDEAERVLTEALALDANSSAANTSLGLVKMRQNKFTEAKSFLEKAVKADSQNYLAFFSYAYVVSRESTTELGFASDYSLADAQKIRENARRAINLNPDFAESYNLFAFVNIIRNEQIDESIEMIKKALTIAPGNQWYGIRLAELYMRKEEFATARDLALKIMQTAADDQMKVYAENTVRTINSLEAQLEAIKNYKKREDDDTITDEPLSDEEIARRREKAMLESLNETLRKKRIGEKRVLGLVSKIECQSEQIVVSILAQNQTLQMRSDSLETVKLISFDPAFVNTQFGCGELKKENLSVVTFRPSANSKAKMAGEIVAIEFVPKNFKFLVEEK